jgi:AraC family transcriptional regulator
VKIAVDVQPILVRNANRPVPGRLTRQVLARGEGWSVSDVVCSAGPYDHAFEEQHSQACIAIVVEGSFQYRSGAGRELMTPGALLLGNAGQHFECGHEHGAGDRCISFAYEPQYFEGVVAEAGVQNRRARFPALRVPPLRELSWLVTRASAGLTASCDGALTCSQGMVNATNRPPRGNCFEDVNRSDAGIWDWEEISLELAARALELVGEAKPSRGNLPTAEARVTRIVRIIESRPDLEHDLGSLAREVKLSRYHFLRVFQQVTGLTPHRYILRARLRRAAARLMLEPARVLDIALDSGFGDVSNFNHAFHAEFGVSPRLYRKNAACRPSK